MSRLVAYVFGLGLVAATAAPGFGDPGKDSYPFSTYPMFARPRGKALVYFAEGINGPGAAVRIRPELVANDEVMQASQSIRRAVFAGGRTLALFCDRIALRVLAAPEHADVLTIQIVGARFDPLKYFDVGPEPQEREVHQRCLVPRSP